MQTLIAPLFNLLVLLALMAYYLREPLKTFALGRASSIREQLKSAHDRLAAARQKHAEFSAKLKAVDAELGALRQQFTLEAEATRVRIAADAQKMSASIVADAKNSSVALYSEFKGRLYSELGERVLDRAEEILRERLTGDDRARIAQEFSHQIQASR